MPSPRHLPARFDPPTPDVLAQRSRFKHAELAPRTVLSYEADWRVFVAWCEAAGRDSLDTLRLYMRSHDPFKGSAMVGL